MSNQNHLDVDYEVYEEKVFNENFFFNYIQIDENLETRSRSGEFSKPIAHDKNSPDRRGRISEDQRKKNHRSRFEQLLMPTHTGYSPENN